MPRKARQKSESGIYHIVMRGINRQNIFNEDEDCHKFIHTLRDYQKISEYNIYAYCLMGNHAHLLIRVGTEPLAQAMRRICGKYVYWYNKKYDRVGYLFQDRYKSEPVEDDQYLLVVMRYIHQNPLKAGMVKNIRQYQWSSYNEYTGRANLADVDFVLKLFDQEKERAVKDFIEFNKQNTDDKCLEIEEKHHLTDQEAVEIIKSIYKFNNAQDIQKLDIKTRDVCLRGLKKHKLSVRQIERVTGISRGVVLKA